MTTTKIRAIHRRIGDVIGYTESPDKTANPAYSPTVLQALRDVMNYATTDFKTERQFYVTGLNCVPEIARDQMALTKRRFGKEKGIVAFHDYQSFAPGEVTPDQAHALGASSCLIRADSVPHPETSNSVAKARQAARVQGFLRLTQTLTAAAPPFCRQDHSSLHGKCSQAHPG